ncbi:MAG TPA: hypothetical protein VLW54_04980 [Candidatus Acidoferrales bacterium]|nr:hypothetical protein [Candidatus Acidoferrales bacterium]
MRHRGIATLAVAAIVACLLLSRYDPQFSLLHIYESAIYMVLLFLLNYEEEEWAYVLGVSAPAVWLALVSASNLNGILRQTERVVHLQAPDYPANLIGAAAMVISLLMLGTCVYRWRQARWGFRHAWRTVGVIAVMVVAYYGVLVAWYSKLVMASG